MDMQSLQWWTFKVTLTLSLVCLIIAVLIAIYPPIFHKIKWFKNSTRKTSFYFFITMMILFFISNTLIPEDFP